MLEDGTGRCFCGDVTYRFKGRIVDVGHCHCESCRRATSSPVTTFFCVEKSAVAFSGGSLSRYRSSADVMRSFCSRCGAQMAFETDRRPEQIDLYLMTLDQRDDVEVRHHWHWNERVSWLHCQDDLPKDEN